MSHDKVDYVHLTEKWEEILDEKTEAPIQEDWRRKASAQLLENTEWSLINESTPTNLAGGNDNWDHILMKLGRRLAPKLIAFDICGLQPMSGPTGLIFALRSRYVNQAGAEAFVNEADTSFSGTGTHTGTDPFDPAYATGTGAATAAFEGDTWNEMGITIDKTSVTATSRQLKATLSQELAQDMKRIHGVDAQTELANILTAELIVDINREVVRTMYRIAQVGAADTTVAGTFDLDADADGRWSVEKFKGMVFQIEREANRIAINSRRGKGNVLVASADVCSALAMAGVLDYGQGLKGAQALSVDPTGTTYVGMFQNRYKVFMDPYATGDFFVVGFKGPNQYDNGFYYCPYIPLSFASATDPVSLQPVIGFKTRYGIVANPFTNLSNGQNTYYRKVKVTNLL